MKIRLQPFLFIFSIFSLISCNQNINDKEIFTLKITDIGSAAKIQLSTIDSSAELIALHTPDSILIDNIIKLASTDEYLFVSDKRSLYKFDSQGNFISVLNRQGRGVDEYTGITDFYVEDTNECWILSRADQTIYHFNPEGELLSTHTFNQWIDKFFKQGDNLYLYLGNETENNNHRIRVYSLTEKEIINSYLDIDPVKSTYLHVHSTNLFSRNSSSDNLYFFELFNDTIYKISLDEILPSLFISLDSKNIPTRFFQKGYGNIMEFFQELFKNSYAYGTDLFIESENQYLLSYFYDKKRILSILNKNTSELISFNTIYEDLHLNGYPIDLTENTIFLLPGNMLAIVLDSMDIMQYAEENMEEDEILKLKEKIAYTPDLMNAVILLIKV